MIITRTFRALFGAMPKVGETYLSTTSSPWALVKATVEDTKDGWVRYRKTDKRGASHAAKRFDFLLMYRREEQA